MAPFLQEKDCLTIVRNDETHRYNGDYDLRISTIKNHPSHEVSPFGRNDDYYKCYFERG